MFTKDESPLFPPVLENNIQLKTRQLADKIVATVNAATTNRIPVNIISFTAEVAKEVVLVFNQQYAGK